MEGNTTYAYAPTITSSSADDATVSSKDFNADEGIIIYEPTKTFKSNNRNMFNATSPTRLSKAELERQAANCIVILDPHTKTKTKNSIRTPRFSRNSRLTNGSEHKSLKVHDPASSPNGGGLTA
ncbi:hypothetical protein ACA910_012339 [Epithemia clementina (nom. ined.)]